MIILKALLIVLGVSVFMGTALYWIERWLFKDNSF